MNLHLKVQGGVTTKPGICRYPQQLGRTVLLPFPFKQILKINLEKIGKLFRLPVINEGNWTVTSTLFLGNITGQCKLNIVPSQ